MRVYRMSVAKEKRDPFPIAAMKNSNPGAGILPDVDLLSVTYYGATPKVYSQHRAIIVLAVRMA